VKSGDGGNGSASFRREKYVPRGGPDGGDGGKGGDVILRAKPNLTSLVKFQFSSRFQADPGGPGRSQQRHGKNGKNLVVDIPTGTIIWDDESGDLLADLTEANDEAVVARGGRGGLGNVHFKSSIRQAPKLAELGEPGQERWLRLELRLIADVGLVGLPNAGKSTLLAATSAAKPKIADYPFTTLEPNLGVVQLGGADGQTFVMADIPGLISGAAEGVGLGLEFLRHIDRTKVLVHVLDASGGLEAVDPLESFDTVIAELAAYDAELVSKPMLVALNKMDLPESRQQLPRLERALREKGFRTFPISGATMDGVQALVEAIAADLRAVNEAEEAAGPAVSRRHYTLDSVDDRAWDIRRESDQLFVVSGAGIERFTRMTNFGNEEAVDRFQRMLSSSGISDQLERLGIQPGDTVRIAETELVWGDQEEFEPMFIPQERV
jgi:GTP-binding protein